MRLALLHRFGEGGEVWRDDGFVPDATVYTIVEGETPTTMAKSTGLAIMELATQFENLAPDIVLTVADRFETMATAIAASYMNIPVAHTQGGEVTGSIDESVRHAITKLAHIHFPATKRARGKHLISMGEDRRRCTYGVPFHRCDRRARSLAETGHLFERYKGVGPASIPPSRTSSSCSIR